jgi:hypothetical protein
MQASKLIGESILKKKYSLYFFANRKNYINILVLLLPEELFFKHWF